MRNKNQSGFGIIELLVAIVFLAVAGFIAYTVVDNLDDDDEKSANNSSTPVDKSSDLPFELSLSNLDPLDQGLYEGWVVRGDTKTSFGTFNMTSDGSVDGSLELEGMDPTDGDTVAISIEPDNDSDPDPSATIILSGQIADGSAELAFPVDISAFNGQYILGTPTTVTTADETAGIWFTLSGSDVLLDIPVAPEGWIYEGWAVYEGTPLTTGQFTDPSKADLFNGYSGPSNAPDKPGEDYIQNLPGDLSGPLDLANGTTKVVVSIEPYQDGSDPTGVGPAQVKPLSATIGAGVADHSTFDLNLSTDSLPSGTVTVDNDLDA